MFKILAVIKVTIALLVLGRINVSIRLEKTVTLGLFSFWGEIKNELAEEKFFIIYFLLNISASWYSHQENLTSLQNLLLQLRSRRLRYDLCKKAVVFEGRL